MCKLCLNSQHEFEIEICWRLKYVNKEILFSNTVIESCTGSYVVNAQNVNIKKILGAYDEYMHNSSLTCVLILGLLITRSSTTYRPTFIP